MPDDKRDFASEMLHGFLIEQLSSAVRDLYEIICEARENKKQFAKDRRAHQASARRYFRRKPKRRV